MAKSNKKLLGEIEKIFQELDYTIRFEKGNFQSGYCLVENTKIVVVNKFFDLEGRLNSLLEILDRIDIDLSLLSPESKGVLKSLNHFEVTNPSLF